MTVSLCIRQESKRNDDSVSVEELDICPLFHQPKTETVFKISNLSVYKKIK